MKTIHVGFGMLVAASLLLSVTACSNPENKGSNVKANKVDAPISVTKNAKIAAMVPEGIRQKGSFVVSLNPDVAPVKFVDSNGKLAGLVPDLLNDAATVMGVKADIQQGSFDAMVPGLESKRFDVIGSIGDFKERQGKIDFIDYMMSGTAILVSQSFKLDKVAPDTDLCGLKVAFARGTAQQGLLDEASKACVAAGNEAVNSTGYGDAASAVLAVKSAQSDAFWGDSASMLYNAKTSPKLYKVVWEQQIAPYGIGINKDNKQLTESLRSALLHLVSTGVYDQLLEKWGQKSFGLPEMPLNSGPSLEK